MGPSIVGVLVELSDRLAERAQELAEANHNLQAEIEERERVETVFRRSLGAADRTQMTLLERDARRRSVFETVPDAMIVIDDQGIMRSFSARRGTPVRFQRGRRDRPRCQHADAVADLSGHLLQDGRRAETANV
jgi:hypothetical protein